MLRGILPKGVFRQHCGGVTARMIGTMRVACSNGATATAT
jgi:hypothetical protein